MELVGNHLQVFISLMLILCAAAVALICELLKRNNEHLRELNAELRVRSEEERLRNQMLMQSAASNAPILTTSPSVAVSPVDSSAEKQSAGEAQPAMERADEYTSRKGTRRSAPAAAVPVEAPQTGATLAEARMLAREFLGRAATRAGHQVPSADPATAEQVRTPEVIVETRHAGAGVKPARKNWDTLLSSTRRAAEAATVEVVAEPRTAPRPRLGELIPFESIQNTSDSLAIPEGFHEGMMLARLLNGEKSVRGLVVVIGINESNPRRDGKVELGAEALVASFTDHLRSILLPGEFACQKSQDEFIMICPGEQEQIAQRRLGQIAEALWDYQFRAIGTSSILFSWGGVEANGEPFSDVLSAASERMQETRRTRRSLSIEVPQRRKAV